jgi:hypothetical protein
VDKVTKKLTAPVTTGQIYWGAIPYVVIQCIMVALVIAFPQMVMVYKDEASTVDPTKIQIDIPAMEEQTQPPSFDTPGAGGSAPADGSAPAKSGDPLADQLNQQNREDKSADDLMNQLKAK